MTRKLRAVDPLEVFGNKANEHPIPLAGETITHIEEYDDGKSKLPLNSDNTHVMPIEGGGDGPPPVDDEREKNMMMGSFIMGCVSFILTVLGWRWIEYFDSTTINIFYLLGSLGLNIMIWGMFFTVQIEREIKLGRK